MEVKMDHNKLADDWIRTFNKQYQDYLYNGKEPRYFKKTFFLNTFYLFNTFGGEWKDYLEKYQEIFKRDPSNDYYKYRDPLVENSEEKRRNTLEWATLFEIVSQVGYPHNNSAKDNLLSYSRQFLKKGMNNPNSDWIDFMFSSAVANLPDEFPFLKDWLPGQISEYIKEECTPHQYMTYLTALRNYDSQKELKDEILNKLKEWIISPKGNPETQTLIWTRLITRCGWLLELMGDDIQEESKKNFLKNLEKVKILNWAYHPMFLECYYLCSDESIQEGILSKVNKEVTPSTFLKIKEIFPFITETDEVFEYNEEIKKIREKCSKNPTQEKCKSCATTKIDDCWIRIISKVTNTEPRPHSGFEVADVVIYNLEQGVYIVIKAKPIKSFAKDGNALIRQCIDLFSHDYALVLYLNPHGTAPHVIEYIRDAAARSRTNPRFGVVDPKYIRQIYKKYKSMQGVF